MARANPQELIEELERNVAKLNNYDNRRAQEFRSRLDDQDPLDRQDIRDLQEMVDGL